MQKQGDVVSRARSQMKDQFEDSLNPSKLFTKANLKKKRGAFWTCFIAAFILVLLVTVAAVYMHVVDVGMFETALLENVNYQAIGTDEASIRSFAKETIHFLSDQQDSWNPQISVGGFPAGSFIPQSFRTHMQTVKDAVSAATSVFLGGAAIVLVLLLRALTSGTRRRHGFSAGGYYLGMLIPLLAIAGVVLWAVLDFDSMWMMLHRALIPDGIFPAGELVMQLFPVSLFEAYLPPIVTSFLLFMAVVALLPLVLAPLSNAIGNRKVRSKAANHRYQRR